jgi:hypothetical protein
MRVCLKRRLVRQWALLWCNAISEVPVGQLLSVRLYGSFGVSIEFTETLLCHI